MSELLHRSWDLCCRRIQRISVLTAILHDASSVAVFGSRPMRPARGGQQRDSRAVQEDSQHADPQNRRAGWQDEAMTVASLRRARWLTSTHVLLAVVLTCALAGHWLHAGVAGNANMATAGTVFCGVFVQAVPFLALGVVVSGLIATFVSPERLPLAAAARGRRDPRHRRRRRSATGV